MNAIVSFKMCNTQGVSLTSWEDPENSDRGQGGSLLSLQDISKRAERTFLKKQLDTRGPIASRGGSVPVFLRKPKTT